MTIDINLPWQAFSVDLNTVQAWMAANAGSSYAGASADSDLSLHFTAEPGPTVRSAIAAYWAGLSTSSPEAENYSPSSVRAASAASAKAALVASATAKLTALGLSADEIAALRG